jgi:hypothetical protein
VAFSDGWVDAGQGWQGRDGQLKLDGWSRSRRVIVLRRALRIVPEITFRNVAFDV